jgi:hypothetical protein
VVTLIGPVVAPLGTVVEIWLSELTVYFAVVPLKATLVVPVNPEPTIVTPAFGAPLAGVKLLITGGPMTLKVVELVPVPADVVTVMAPVVAVSGTTTVIWLFESTVNELAEVPLKPTAVAPVKFEPLTVTLVPVEPLVGMKELMTGPLPPGSGRKLWR